MASDIIADGQPSNLNLRSVEQITLDVAGRKFVTTIGSLVERSDYFAAAFSGRWVIPRAEDGSVFIDSDPDIFAHILRYLRRGVFPLAYDEKLGTHNLKLYVELLPEARYFQIPMLEAWLADELYLQCVTHSSTWRPIQVDRLLSMNEWASSPTAELVKYKTLVEHSWICPDMLNDRFHMGAHGFRGCSPPDKQGALDSSETTMWAEYTKKLSYCKGWCSDEGYVYGCSDELVRISMAGSYTLRALFPHGSSLAPRQLRLATLDNFPNYLGRVSH